MRERGGGAGIGLSRSWLPGRVSLDTGGEGEACWADDEKNLARFLIMKCTRSVATAVDSNQRQLGELNSSHC
jgi:hypothetical protein